MYSPSNRPRPENQLGRWVEDEFRKLSELLHRGDDRLIVNPSNAAPAKPRTGVIAYADGTNWDPTVEPGGLHYYADGAWWGVLSTKPRWDDLRFPSQGINPPGAASDPTRSTTTGLLHFSGTQDNVITGVAQMPHAWKEGSDIHPHLHLQFPTANANTSRWKFEYDIANVNADFTNAYGVYTVHDTISVVNPNNAKRQKLSSFSAISMTNRTVSSCIVWKISRLASSDAADNDTSEVVLIEFDIHYELDSLGSASEYTK